MSEKTLRPNLPQLPTRIAQLPVDDRGYPVPWFVAWIDGKPDFRVIGPGKTVQAVREKLCWVCGQRLGTYFAFVIGPMCAINRVSGEPPSHLECAEFSARACPFLTTPKERRREDRLPDGTCFSETGLKRNPGVALVWVTKTFTPIRGVGNEVLFRIGNPTSTLWCCEGRTATREEVLRSVETGLPSLKELAEQDGPRAMAMLEKQCNQAAAYYPPL